MPFRTDISQKSFVGIGIDLTEECNRRCPTCFATRTPRNMTMDLFQRIVDQAVNIGFTEIYILGGEPTLHAHILDCLKYAADKFTLVFLVTNMDRLANYAFCKAVADLGVVIAGQRHTLAADDESDGGQEHILSGGNHLNSSNQAWKNVASLFSADHVCVQCCITAPVVKSGSIYDVFRFARRMNYEPVMEFTKEGGNFKRGCTLDVPSYTMFEVLKEFQRIDREEFRLPGAEILTPQAYGKTCHMQETSIHFGVNGDTVPCVGHPGLTYGNISEVHLSDILSHPLRSHIAQPKSWVYGYCRDECQYFESCTGGCRGSSFDMSGCYRASFYYCPHIPQNRLSLSDMIPPTCSGCPLEGNPTCHPKR